MESMLEIQIKESITRLYLYEINEMIQIVVLGVLLLAFSSQYAGAAMLGSAGALVDVEGIRVVDGDTVVVSSKTEPKITTSVRLACIDAPEAKQAFGTNSRSSLNELLFPAKESLKVKIIQASDRYQRPVVELFAANGENINVKLLESGNAFVYPYYLKNCDEKVYSAAENTARNAKKGIWSVPGGTTRPWDCRRSPTKCRGFARRLLLS